MRKEITVLVIIAMALIGMAGAANYMYEKASVKVDEIMAAIAELGWKEHASNTGFYNQLRKLDAPRPAPDHVMLIEVRAEGRTISAHSFPPGRIIVGRAPDNEIYIKSKFVSRHHAQLMSDDDGCLIEDLNSTNGIFLGSRQIKKHHLQDGDIVSLGVHELAYTDLRNRGAAAGARPADNEDLDDAPAGESASAAAD